MGVKCVCRLEKSHSDTTGGVVADAGVPVGVFPPSSDSCALCFASHTKQACCHLRGAWVPSHIATFFRACRNTDLLTVGSTSRFQVCRGHPMKTARRPAGLRALHPGRARNQSFTTGGLRVCLRRCVSAEACAQMRFLYQSPLLSRFPRFRIPLTELGRTSWRIEACGAHNLRVLTW